MDLIENARDQPVFKADEGADGQEGLNARRAGYRGNDTPLQLVHEQGELQPDKERDPKKKILDNLSMQRAPVL